MFLFVDAINMIRQIRATSKKMRIWGGLLNMTQLIGALAFLLVLEAQVILATLVVTLMIAGQIHKRAPFSRLVGLCHVPWLALLPWLLYRLQTVEHGLAFSIWAYVVCALIFVSLVFDVYDVARYLRGGRTYAWSERSPPERPDG